MAGKTIMSFRTLEIWEPINFYDFRMGSWNPLLKFDGFPGTRGTRACQVPDNDVFAGQDFEVPDVSKAMTVRKFRTLVKNVTEVDPKLQSLYFGGKVMHDECDLCDYRIVS